MNLKISLSLGLLVACAAPLFAEDVFRSIPLNQIKVTGGASARDDGESWRWRGVTPDGVECEGAAEAVIDGRADVWSGERQNLRVIFKVPDGAKVTGRLRLNTGGHDGKKSPQSLQPFTFSATEGAPATVDDFNAAKVRRYDALLGADIPGEGWFRYQRDHYKAALKNPVKTADEANRLNRFRDRDADTALALFTGDSAIRDNLQLDRPLRLTPGVGERTVDIATLEGVTVKEFDWSTVLKPGDTALDPLASCVPSDQHVVFFKSFDGMLRTLDEADTRGTPLLTAAIPRSGDARTKARYQKQLCLDVTELARAAGPYLVDGIAFTGSDLYLPGGSDVGIAFSSKQSEVLGAFFRAKHALAAKADSGCAVKSGELSGVAWSGVVNADRTVSSYVATRSGAVFVSNSLVQLGRMLDAASGASPSLAKLPEFKFFRQRYALADAGETALVYVSDATIRRWCGPRWRILAARRAEAAAALGVAASSGVTDAKAVSPASPEHGTIAFMTPIAELPCDKVTPAEAAAYKGWRDSYQRGWRQFFDPIAIRLSLTEKKYSADVTVMPLILGGEYREMMAFTRNGEIRADACDPRPGALLHYALAIDPESRHIRSMESMFDGSRREAASPLNVLKPKPFAWLGTSLSLRLDPDAVVTELGKIVEEHGADSEEFRKAALVSWAQLPVSLWVDSRDQASLAFFMTALRGMVDSSAPGVVTWATAEHAAKPYVVVSGPQNSKIHYHVGKTALFATLSESTMKAYLDRLDAPATKAAPTPASWLGKHACLRIDGAMINVFDGLMRDDHRTRVQRASWSALPVLNELRRAAPDKDPVALYEKLWGVALTCPAGGRYVWNAESGTMESTVTGSPVAPKEFRPARIVLPGIASGEFGLTFEHDGVRARLDLVRESVKADAK
jgi:hypothetical protein